MAFEPNEEQKLFLDSKNCNVLVSASAGSGKTSTMIQKLMKILIEEKVPVQKLLVLTFTDAAASEIKQKLFSAISENIESVDASDRAYLKEQLDKIGSAEIGTLHSVCKKLIIKYFYELEESPDFSLLAERESKYLIDISMSNVFEKHIKNGDDDFFELYDCYNSKRNDTSLKKMLLTLFNYIRNKCNYEDWLNSALNLSFETNLNSNLCCKYLFDYAKDELQVFLPQIDNLITYAKGNSLDKYELYLNEKKQILNMLLSATSFVQMQKILFDIPSVSKPRKSNKSEQVELELSDQIDLFNKDYNDCLKSIKTNFVCDSENQTKENILNSKQNVNKLIRLTQEILEEYNRLKKTKNALDFNDLEDKMLKLLENEKIAIILRENYQFVFFDEYQDINEKQELILSKLVSSDNYYMIGDVKQSIYAFRQSSPKIFVNKFFAFQNDNKNNKLINFNKNYRSDRNILEFNNIVFDQLITENTIGINYKENSRFQSKKEFVNCNTFMKIINSNVDSEDFEEDIDKEKKEAMLIADTISQLLTTKKEDGNYFDYKDIAIILRKRGTFVKTLCDTLIDLQIPVNATISSEFFQTFEIELLMSICQVSVNYKNDIPLCVVLKNLFEINDEQLYKIRVSSESKNMFEAIKNYDKQDDILDKLNLFFQFLEWSKNILSSSTIYEYLQKTLEKFNLKTKLKSSTNGFEKVQNIDEFLQLADSENYKYNMDKFVEYLKFVSSDTQLQKIGSSSNCVQIMTIHYSKGLEYPAVILGGLGKKFSINKDTNDIIINENLGFGLKSIDSENRILCETIVRNACKIDNKKNELNEEIRLLYVAMTRPKEKLFLIGEYNLENFEKNKLKNIYQSKNYFDLIFKAIPNVYNSNFVNLKNFTLNENKDSCCEIQFFDYADILEKSKKENENITIGECDCALRNEFCNLTEKTPNLNTFTIKNTVTNILNEENDYEILNNNPYKLDESDKLESKDALILGSAYHSIMQNLKFTENEAEISQLISRLVSENEILSEYAKLIDIQEILQAKEILKDYILTADKVFKEKQFVMQQNYNKIVKNSDNNTKVIIQGVIDLVVIKEGKAILIDYKTNKTNNENFLKQNYSLQLEIYKQAFESATGIKIDKKYLYSFYLKKLIEVI